MPLIGHLDQQAIFLDAFRAERMHHAWLLAGPVGIGKAVFAHAAATYVLARAAGPAAGIASDRLQVDPEHRIAKLIEAGSHLDLRTLTREPNDAGKLRAEIVVDQVRALQPLFQTTPGLSDWRVIIVDSVDAMNRAAANAFLKNLEEPPANTLFLLVSHAPGRLLPTIRSRCRMLRFQPLNDADTRAVLRAQLPEASEAEIDSLVRLAEGRPGRALHFAGLDVEGLLRALDDIASTPPARSSALALDLAKSLAAKSAQPRYEAFLELTPAYLSRHAQTASGARLANVLALWEKAAALSSQALPLSLEPQSVAFELASLVGALDR